MSRVRISGLHVELCQILGAVLHTVLPYPFLKTECWTFRKREVWDGDIVDHDLHLGEGFLYTEANTEDRRFFKQGDFSFRVALRTVCIPHSSAMGMEWEIALWLKFPNGSISDHFFTKEALGKIAPKEPRVVFNSLPPDEIKFR